MKDQQSVSNNIDNSLEQQALSELNAKHYKEAIDLYKQLWETSDDKKWQQQLAYCYLQRALSFAERAMYREALLLWDHYIQFAESPDEAYDHYICWQIQSQNSNNIQSALKLLSAQQIDKQYPELAALLGCLLLTEHPEFQRYLPQNSIFIAHLKLAQTALQAFLENNQQQLNEALKQLPYRSAFRDFRTLLNTVQNHPQSIEQALTKLPVNSPYLQTINLLQTCTLDGTKLVQQLAKCSYAQRSIIAEIKGVNNQQQQLIESLIQYPDNVSDKVKFNLLLQHQSLWTSGIAENFCKSLLINYPEGLKDFNNCFTTLDRFENNRIKALANERKGNNVEAEQYWRQCVEALIDQSADNTLKIALIIRHMAARQAELESSIQLTIESLDYDAEDLVSYLKILQYFNQYDAEIVEYQQWLHISLEKFPHNIELLSFAVQVANINKEYKKACEYALTLSSIDPLNNIAKQTLFFGYLEQARQLILNKEFPLVEQQIKQAEDLKLGKKYQARAQLIRGLFFFANKDKTQAQTLIDEALKTIHQDPVNAILQAAMEALLTEIPVASILEGLKPAEDYLLTDLQLNGVIQQLNHYGKDFDHQLLLLKALDRVKSALLTSLSQQQYDQPLLLVLSQTLDNINAFDLLQHCAKVAAAKWNAAIWQYYLIYSDLNGMAEKCSSAQINRLENIREQAITDKDDRTKVLIDVFVEQYYQAHSETSTGFISNLFDLNDDHDDEYVDPTEQLFKHIPEDDLLKISNKTEELMMETSPEQLVKELTQDSDNNEHILIAMMQDPDLFSALMVIKASASLGININLNINDILGFFNVAPTYGSDTF